MNPAYEAHPDDDDGFTDSDQEDASEPTEVEKVIAFSQFCMCSSELGKITDLSQKDQDIFIDLNLLWDLDNYW